jgi:hypothetical protein
MGGHDPSLAGVAKEHGRIVMTLGTAATDTPIFLGEGTHGAGG